MNFSATVYLLNRASSSRRRALLLVRSGTKLLTFIRKVQQYSQADDVNSKLKYEKFRNLKVVFRGRYSYF